MSKSEKIEIIEYDGKYAKEMSEIILNNLYTINIKDYGKEVIDGIAIHFTEEEIKKNFPERVKCFVALKNGKVVGTASIDTIKDIYGVEVDNNRDKYIILTVILALVIGIIVLVNNVGNQNNNTINYFYSLFI